MRILIGFAVVILCWGYAIHLVRKSNPQATQQPEPCHCLTYEELAAYTAFMEVYVDSNQNGRKSDRKRFSDSVAKYKNLLKIK